MDRKSYHHGDLPRALVEAALELIAEKGVGGFTIAEAARRAGVSPAAPYRHFRDRDALLAETARRGFALFAERLKAARAAAGASPLRAFEAVGRAYIAFARDEPAYFAAMFSPDAELADDAEAFAARESAFGVLYDACDALLARLPPDRRPPTHMAAYHAWSMAHGVASLFGHRGAGARRAPIPADEMLESLTAIYLRGLGLVPSES